MSEYDEGWNAAILAVLKLAEDARDHAYKMEDHAKRNGLSGSPSGYRADGLRDFAEAVRPFLRIEHFPPIDIDGEAISQLGVW